MKKIGVLFGMENSFPGALVEHINARHVEGIEAEFVDTGAVHLNRAPKYAVIVDRIPHDIPFYRPFLKPVNGGGWRDVYHVHNREEFFHAYDQSGNLCMMYQKAVNFNEYFRCYV